MFGERFSMPGDVSDAKLIEHASRLELDLMVLNSDNPEERELCASYKLSGDVCLTDDPAAVEFLRVLLSAFQLAKGGAV